MQDMAGLLLALTALDLGVNLIGAGIEQLDGLILEVPHVAVVAQVSVFGINALTRDQLRGLDSYCCCLCYQRRRASRAGRQAKAEQPNREQACCFV